MSLHTLTFRLLFLSGCLHVCSCVKYACIVSVCRCVSRVFSGSVTQSDCLHLCVFMPQKYLFQYFFAETGSSFKLSELLHLFLSCPSECSCQQNIQNNLWNNIFALYRNELSKNRTCI